MRSKETEGTEGTGNVNHGWTRINTNECENGRWHMAGAGLTRRCEIGEPVWVKAVGIALVLTVVLAVPARAADQNWLNTGGDKGGSRYSTLTQINRESVSKLEMAWMFHTGDGGKQTTIECTPIVIDGAMYVTTAGTKVVAL